MKKTQGKNKVRVEVKSVITEDKVRIERMKKAYSKIDIGGQEHTKRYIKHYEGVVKTLKALLKEGVDLSYNEDKSKSENNAFIAKQVVKKGFELGYLVKGTGNKVKPYSSDTFEDVLRELFVDTRGRGEGINELIGENVQDLFLRCSAIGKQKFFRSLAEIEKEEGDKEESELKS